jgi:hypothetical protein
MASSKIYKVKWRWRKHSSMQRDGAEELVTLQAYYRLATIWRAGPPEDRDGWVCQILGGEPEHNFKSRLKAKDWVIGQLGGRG